MVASQATRRPDPRHILVLFRSPAHSCQPEAPWVTARRPRVSLVFSSNSTAQCPPRRPPELRRQPPAQESLRPHAGRRRRNDCGCGSHRRHISRSVARRELDRAGSSVGSIAGRDSNRICCRSEPPESPRGRIGQSAPDGALRHQVARKRHVPAGPAGCVRQAGGEAGRSHPP